MPDNNAEVHLKYIVDNLAEFQQQMGQVWQSMLVPPTAQDPANAGATRSGESGIIGIWGAQHQREVSGQQGHFITSPSPPSSFVPGGGGAGYGAASQMTILNVNVINITQVGVLNIAGGGEGGAGGAGGGGGGGGGGGAGGAGGGGAGGGRGGGGAAVEDLLATFFKGYTAHIGMRTLDAAMQPTLTGRGMATEDYMASMLDPISSVPIIGEPFRMQAQLLRTQAEQNRLMFNAQWMAPQLAGGGPGSMADFASRAGATPGQAMTETLGGLGKWVGAGAIAGSFIEPGLGTAIGAAVGAVGYGLNFAFNPGEVARRNRLQRAARNPSLPGFIGDTDVDEATGILAAGDPFMSAGAMQAAMVEGAGMLGPNQRDPKNFMRVMDTYRELLRMRRMDPDLASKLDPTRLTPELSVDELEHMGYEAMLRNDVGAMDAVRSFGAKKLGTDRPFRELERERAQLQFQAGEERIGGAQEQAFLARIAGLRAVQAGPGEILGAIAGEREPLLRSLQAARARLNQLQSDWNAGRRGQGLEEALAQAQGDVSGLTGRLGGLPFVAAEERFQATMGPARAALGIGQGMQQVAGMTQFGGTFTAGGGLQPGAMAAEAQGVIQGALQAALSAASRHLSDLMRAGSRDPTALSEAAAAVANIQKEMAVNAIQFHRSVVEGAVTQAQLPMQQAGAVLGAVSAGVIPQAWLPGLFQQQTQGLSDMIGALNAAIRDPKTTDVDRARYQLQLTQAQVQQRLQPLQQIETAALTPMMGAQAQQAEAGIAARRAQMEGLGGMDMVRVKQGEADSLTSELGIMRSTFEQKRSTGLLTPEAEAMEEARIHQKELQIQQVQSNAWLRDVPLSTQSALATASFQRQVLETVPGARGDIYAVTMQEVGIRGKEIAEAQRQLAAGRASGKMDAEDIFRSEQNIRQLQLQQLTAYQELSQGWQHRLMSEVVGAPSSFALASTMTSFRAAVGFGVNFPGFGALGRGQRDAFMGQARPILHPAFIPGWRGGIPGQFGVPSGMQGISAPQGTVIGNHPSASKVPPASPSAGDGPGGGIQHKPSGGPASAAYTTRLARDPGTAAPAAMFTAEMGGMRISVGWADVSGGALPQPGSGAHPADVPSMPLQDNMRQSDFGAMANMALHEANVAAYEADHPIAPEENTPPSERTQRDLWMAHMINQRYTEQGFRLGGQSGAFGAQADTFIAENIVEHRMHETRARMHELDPQIAALRGEQGRLQRAEFAEQRRVTGGRAAVAPTRVLHAPQEPSFMDRVAGFGRWLRGLVPGTTEHLEQETYERGPAFRERHPYVTFGRQDPRGQRMDVVGMQLHDLERQRADLPSLSADRAELGRLGRMELEQMGHAYQDPSLFPYGAMVGFDQATDPAWQQGILAQARQRMGGMYFGQGAVRPQPRTVAPEDDPNRGGVVMTMGAGQSGAVYRGAGGGPGPGAGAFNIRISGKADVTVRMPNGGIIGQGSMDIAQETKNNTPTQNKGPSGNQADQFQNFVQGNIVGNQQAI